MTKVGGWTLMGTKQSDYNEKDDRHENHIPDHHLDQESKTNLKLGKPPATWRLLLLWSKTRHNLELDAVVDAKTANGHHLGCS